MKSLGKGIVTWSYEQYRSNAKKEYDHFWRAFFRELIQNSSDAGSTTIVFWLNEEKNVIEIADDGCGMDLDVIQNKLLVIGGSQKSEGSVGGLGKAKELLFFSQPKWEIATNLHYIIGEGGEYEIFERSEKQDGTIIQLHQPSDVIWMDLRDALSAVATQCQLRASLFIKYSSHDTLEQYDTAHPVGKLVRTLPGIGNLYYAKTRDGEKLPERYRMIVRVNGCWMFNRWIGEHQGEIVLDIDSTILDPIDGLSANRDALKPRYSDQLNKVIEEIIIDKRSALVVREPSITTLHGNGSIYSKLPTDDEIDKLCAFLVGQGAEPIAKGDDLNMTRLKMLASMCESDADYESSAEQFAHIIDYEPDFVIYEDPENDDWNHARIQKFMETQKASTIAKVWTETLKQVLLDNEIEIRFVVGFLFSREAEAMYKVYDDRANFYINPTFVPPTGVQNKVYFVNYMRTTAIHEITHKFHNYHDESFITRYHDLESNTWDSHRIYSKIGTLR